MSRGADSNSRVQGLAARQCAVSALNAIFGTGTTLDTALDDVLDGLSEAQDRRLVRAIVTTTLRRRGQIDDTIKRFVTRSLPAKSGATGTILQVAAAQLLFMRIPAHAAIDVAVRQARLDRDAQHFTGLINAVLRKISVAGQDITGAQDAAHLNTPAWLWQRWQDVYGVETGLEIMTAHLEEPPLDISLKISANGEEWAGKLGGEMLPNGSVRIGDARGRIDDMPGYHEGAWWVQDFAAALPVRLLGHVAGLRVLDLCAAPGGKTAQLSAAGAQVTAVDTSKRRLRRLEQNLERLQLEAETVHADATTFQSETPFDAVIIDAPCSATGTIRRHPDLPYLRTADQLLTSRPLQAAVLRNAVDLTRSGGQIIYCTCSLEPEEGADQIDELLNAGLPAGRRPVNSGDVFGLDHLVEDVGDLRTLPCHLPDHAGGMDGFYACRLVKS